MQRKMTKAEFLLFTVYINFWEVLILVLIVHIYELSIYLLPSILLLLVLN